jgi:hypothetical protein
MRYPAQSSDINFGFLGAHRQFPRLKSIRDNGNRRGREFNPHKAD